VVNLANDTLAGQGMNDATLKSRTPLQNRKLRILLADNSPAVLHRLRQDLEQLQFVEIVAESQRSHETLELFFRTRPEVVVVSICLPEESGFEVLRHVKRAAADCAVILTSRWLDSFVHQTARLLGAAGVCSTTDGCTQLGAMLQSLIEQPAPPETPRSVNRYFK